MRVCSHRRAKTRQDLSSLRFFIQNLLHMSTGETVFKNARKPPSIRDWSHWHIEMEDIHSPWDLLALQNHKAAWRASSCSLIIRHRWGHIKAEAIWNVQSHCKWKTKMKESITYPSSNRDFPFLGERQEGTPPQPSTVDSDHNVAFLGKQDRASKELCFRNPGREGISWRDAGSLRWKGLSYPYRVKVLFAGWLQKLLKVCFSPGAAAKNN